MHSMSTTTTSGCYGMGSASWAPLRMECALWTALLVLSSAVLTAAPARCQPPNTMWVVTEAHWSVCSVAFSPDGGILASGAQMGYDVSGHTKLWRVPDGAPLGSISERTSMVSSVAFSPDGSTIASGGSDKTIKLWRASDGALIRTLEGHTDRVHSVAFSPDGSTIASGSWDKTIKLWRASDGALIRTLKGFTTGVASIAFSPDGSLLAYAYGEAVGLLLLPGEIVKGDVNGDGKVSIADAALALRIAVGAVRATIRQVLAGDLVDQDGFIGIAEAVVILRAAVGLEKL